MPEHLASGLPPDVSGTILTVGTFDGIHLGHQDLLGQVAQRSRATGMPSLVVTFQPHPLEVVNPTAAPLLLTPGEEKFEAIADTGVDFVGVLPFTSALAAYSPTEFVLEILLRHFRLRELWIGYDHGLGRGRQGDASTLRAMGQQHGFPVEVVEAVTGNSGTPYSSTAIRSLVAHGELGRAADALGRRYSFRGRVVAGEQRGRELGYPTLNIALASDRKLLPPHGVYAVVAQTPRGTFGGMMNLGPRPTFGEQALSLEVHLFGAAGDWYGLSVRVEFVARLRDVMAFSGASALVQQLDRDAESARRALTEVREGLNLEGSTHPPTSP